MNLVLSCLLVVFGMISRWICLWQVTAGPFIAASGCSAPEEPAAGGGIDVFSWVGGRHITHYKVMDPGWFSTQKVHGCFLAISRGSNSGINIAKPWKNHGFWSFFFDTKTNCRDIILCTFGAKSGPRDFRAFATQQKHAFRGHRPVHPQIASNSCAILWSFSTLLIDTHCMSWLWMS